MKSKTKRSIKLATLIGTSLLLTSGVAATLSSCVITWKDGYFPISRPDQTETSVSQLLPKNGIDWKKVKKGEQKLYIKDGIVYKDNTETEVIAIVPLESKLPDAKLVKSSIVLPKTVKKISYYTNITKDANGTITRTIRGAFESIDKINNIDLSKCKNLTSIEGPAFKNLKNLTSITLSEKVTSLPDASFENTPKLKNINGINRITTIGQNTFKGSFSDTDDINLDLQSISSIGNNAFENTNKLKTITSINTSSSELTLGTSIFKNSGITSLDISNRTLPNNTLPTSTFENASQLTTFSLNSNLSSIGANAFKGTKITTANLNSYNSLSSIGANAFANTTALTSITFPSSISNLQSGVLSGSNVSTVNLQSTGITNLPTGVLSGLSNLTSVTLPSNIQSIGNSAFENCAKLSTISGLNGAHLSSIGNYAFKGCSTITGNLTFGAGLTSLGSEFLNGTNVTNVNLGSAAKLKTLSNNAFRNNTKITNITLPTSMTSIGNSAFEGATELATTNLSSLSSLTSIGNSAFKGTKLSNANLTSNSALTSIGNSAFENIAVLNSINLPSSLTTIGNSAFKGTALTQINLMSASSLQTIGNEAFNSLRNVTNLQLPNSVTSIGTSAFEALGADVSNLTINNLPTSLTSIGNSAFKNSKISTISNLNSLTQLTTIGPEAFNGTQLTSVDLSGSTQLTTIGNSAFKSTQGSTTKISTIKLPTSVRTIGDGAFKYASATSIDMSNLNSLTTIGQGAFAENTSLNDLKLPSSASNLDIQDGAFYKTSSLTSVDLPSSLTQLKRGVFAESGLTSLNLNNKVVSDIGIGAFYKTSLTSLDLSSNSTVTAINDLAFSEIPSLTSVKFPNSLTTLGSQAFAKSNNNSFTKIDMKDTQITRLNDGVFLETKITDVTLPKTLITMGNNVFSNANSPATSLVTNVTWEPTTATALPNNFYNSGNFAHIANLTLGGKIASLPTNRPNNNPIPPDSLTVVDLSNANDLTSIPNNAFIGTSISTIKLPTSLTSIGNSAFADTDVASISNGSSSSNNTLPSSLTSIGERAFSNTTALANLDLSNTKVTAIPTGLFEGSSQLTSVKLPTGVTSIGDDAFNGANKLANLNSVTTKSNTRAPDGLDLSMYSSLTSIGATAFGNTMFTKIEKDKLPSSLTTIGEGAFSSMDELTTVDLTNLSSLTNIANALFSGNNKLTSVKLPTSVTSIEPSAFQQTGLTTINLDQLTNLESIGSYAFANIDSLTSLDLSNTKITNLPANLLDDSGGGTTSSPYLGRTFKQNKAGNQFSLKLPSTVMTIDKDAFVNFKGQNLDLGNIKVSSPDFNLDLSGATNLTSFSVPHGVTTINTDIVDHATSLTKLTLPGTAINWNQSGDLTTEPVAKTQLNTVEFNVEAVNKNKASSFENINWEQVVNIVNMFAGYNGIVEWNQTLSQISFTKDQFLSAWKTSNGNQVTQLSSSTQNATRTEVNNITWTYTKNTNTSSNPYFAQLTGTISYFRATNARAYSFGKNTENDSQPKTINIKINLY